MQYFHVACKFFLTYFRWGLWWFRFSLRACGKFWALGNRKRILLKLRKTRWVGARKSSGPGRCQPDLKSDRAPETRGSSGLEFRQRLPSCRCCQQSGRTLTDSKLPPTMITSNGNNVGNNSISSANNTQGRRERGGGRKDGVRVGEGSVLLSVLPRNLTHKRANLFFGDNDARLLPLPLTHVRTCVTCQHFWRTFFRETNKTKITMRNQNNHVFSFDIFLLRKWRFFLFWCQTFQD